MIPKDENMHSPLSPGSTNEKHTAHGGDPDQGTFEEIAQCAAVGEISEYAVTIEGEEQTTWFVWLLVCCLRYYHLGFAFWSVQDEQFLAACVNGLSYSQATTLVSSLVHS